ncbi:heat shock factor protein-like isoform X2 [Penaeus japonicus]|uniref:heat shock factor protein-like isoform X2 n=1 Tax=Penaeus japonicus TaxID=27405 RepID=UPI001C711EE8|nr:heat shock factor protein-like isoform X2 [Penaeus japonicus]
MHAIEGSGNVPAFLTKLWRLVDDVKTNDLICWTQNGRSFIIRNQARFSRDLLPQYYKHNNMASFVRQLNMYGFHKVVSADSGGLRLERDEMEFAHPHFLRGQEALIENIKRKQQRRLASDGVEFSQIPTSRTMILEENKSVSKLLCDVRDMKRDQDSMSTKLLGLKRENEALWREYASMRQKFSKQQQIIEKLIHFLIAMVKSPSKTLAPKRKFGHLALEGGEDASSATAKLNNLTQFTQGTTMDVVTGNTSGIGGAQIHEVTDVMDSEDPDIITNIFTVSEENESGVEQVPLLQTTTSREPEELAATFEEICEDPLEPETILMLKSDAVPVSTTTAVPTVVSPGGTALTEENTEFPDLNLDESPLSPELLETVDPSIVTQSFKYASNNSTVSSSASNGMIDNPGTSSRTQAPSTSTQIVVPQKGKNKSMKSQKTPPKSKSTMSIAVPEKSLQKNSKGSANGGQELQNHVDDMQTTIDSLQDLLSSGTFNVDPSMLLTDLLTSGTCNLDPLTSLTMFNTDDNYIPELDSMAAASGNEVSVYNPSLFDLASDIEEDPLSFLNNPMPTSSTSTPDASPVASSSASAVKSSSNKSGPSPAKHLRLSIKKELDDYDELNTPQISPSNSTKPVFRGKKRGN